MIMQGASNRVAEFFANSIIQSNSLPTLNDIVKLDGGAGVSPVFNGQLHAGETYTSNYSPWSGTVLFAYLGDGQPFRDWILNLHPVQNSGTEYFKALGGTYDLVSVAAAAHIVSDSLPGSDVLIQIRDVIDNNSIGRTDTESLLQNLRTEATSFFESAYGLPNEGRFQIGGDLPLCSNTEMVSGFDYLVHPRYILGTEGNDQGIVTFDSGGSNSESALAYSGNDIVNAGPGNDTIIGSTGNDLIDGATGTDTVSYAGLSGGITVTEEQVSGTLYTDRLDVTKSAGGLDYLYGVEKVIGTASADTFNLISPANRVIGGGGGSGNSVSYALPVTLEAATGLIWDTHGTGRDTLVNFDPSNVHDILAVVVADTTHDGFVPLTRHVSSVPPATFDLSEAKAGAAISIDTQVSFRTLVDHPDLVEVQASISTDIQLYNGVHLTGNGGGTQVTSVDNIPSEMQQLAYDAYIGGTNYGDTVTINGNFVSHVGFVAGKGDDIITLSSPGFDPSNPSTGIVANISVTYTGGHDVINNANLLQTLFAPAPVSTTAVSGGTLLTFADGGTLVLGGTSWHMPDLVLHGDPAAGTWGRDVLTATTDGQTIYALGGDDVITAGPGHSILYGGSGNDRYIVSGAAGHFAEIHDLPGTADGINRIELTDVSSSALTANVSDGVLGLYNNGVQFASVDGYDSFWRHLFRRRETGFGRKLAERNAAVFQCGERQRLCRRLIFYAGRHCRSDGRQRHVYRVLSRRYRVRGR